MTKNRTGGEEPIDDVVSLATLGGGVAVELFDFELDRVLENIADESTDPEAPREITLKVTFKPSADRRSVARKIKVVANKLAGPEVQPGTIYVGRRHGVLVAVEYDPAQADLFDPDRGADVVPIKQEGKSNGS